MESKGLFETEDYTTEFDTQDIQRGKIWCIFAYVGFLFFLPLVGISDSRYGKFHANQGLVLLIFDVILGIVGGLLQWILGLIPVLGTILGVLIQLAISVSIFALAIYGIVQAAQGQAKTLPLIGGFTLIHWN